MKIRAKDFFSRAEKEQIKKSVKAAEERTTGEIAVMLVDESDRYREAEVAGTIATASFVSTFVSLILDYAMASSWSLVPDPHYTSIWFWIPATAVLLRRPGIFSGSSLTSSWLYSAGEGLKLPLDNARFYPSIKKAFIKPRIRRAFLCLFPFSRGRCASWVTGAYMRRLGKHSGTQGRANW